MTGNIIIENHQGRAVEIHIEGIIGMPERDSSPRTHSNTATYARFRQQLEKLQAVRTSELIVHIRSTGGNVNDALLIHDTLRNLDCEITTRCYGYIASAATLIAQAASPGKREMSANGLYLIHRAACNSEGDADTLGEASRMLHKTDEQIARIYAERSGMPQQHFTELMNRNHGNDQWLTPEEAKTSGLIDTIFTADSVTNRTEAPSLHTDLSELPLTFNLNDSTMTIKQHWNAILDLLGLSPVGKTHPTTAPAAAEPAGTAALTSSFAEDTIDVSAVTALPSLENCIREIASLKAQVASLEQENARLQAQPTRTKPREDPSPTESRISGNALSYNEDIRSFKQ